MTTHAVFTAPALDASSLDPAARQERLAGRVGRLRTRTGTGSLDRWLLLVGGVLIPLGFLLVIMGWIGASRTPYLFEQIPYMISGGLLGIALVFAGGFVYFAYWQTLLVRESRTAREDLQAALARIEVLLASGAVGAPDVAVPAPNGLVTGLVATSTGSMLHRPDCAVVAGRTNLRAASADEPGLTACGLCEPLAASS
jgi:multisubunit Na+/H+ antiporter MnhG subunit